MDLYALKNEFDQTGIMICFNGPFYHSIIEEIGTAVRNHLAAVNISQGALMDVFAVYIELTHNVRNYITLRGITRPEVASSIITIGRSSNGYEVSSGNIVLNKDAEMVCMRVDEVNAMTQDEVKSQYRKQMRSDVARGALGAGLGFLEIAKRSFEKIKYTAKDLNTTSKFLTLTAFV